MKGVILAIARGASIVDISHEVIRTRSRKAPFSSRRRIRYSRKRRSTWSSWIRESAPRGVRSWSKRPGSTSSALTTEYSQWCTRVRAQSSRDHRGKYFLQPVSRTFHGRDIFAPAAAHLAKGARASSFGKLIDDHLKLGFMKPDRSGKRTWVGTVLHVDRFGNLITNFHIEDFGNIRVRAFELGIGVTKLTRLGLTYAEVDAGEPFVIVGSSGYLEVAANQGSAARILGCGTGAPCELTMY